MARVRIFLSIIAFMAGLADDFWAAALIEISDGGIRDDLPPIIELGSQLSDASISETFLTELGHKRG
jgi:hypothetical protein